MFRKTLFALLIFFAVCEYFEEKYDYDAPLLLPQNRPSQGVFIAPPDQPIPQYSNVVDLNAGDELEHVNETAVGSEGMRVDREMFRSFQDEVRSNQEFVEIYEKGNIDEAVSYLKNKILGEDRPKFYMTPEKIRKIFNLDRRLDLREILELIMTDKEPRTRSEYIKDKFDEFVNDKELGEELVGDLYNNAFELFDAYITNPAVADAIDTKNYSLLAGFGSISIGQLKTLGPDLINRIVEYIHDYINVDKLRVKG